MTGPDQHQDRAEAQRAFAQDLAARFACLMPFVDQNTGTDVEGLRCNLMFADICGAMIAGRIEEDATARVFAHLDAHTGDAVDATSNLVVLGLVDYTSPSEVLHAKLLPQLGPNIRARHRRWRNY